MINGLIDQRNATLFNTLKKDNEIEVEMVKDTEEYACYSIDQQSTIYVPETRICPASFTHELLHIYLRSKGVFIGSRLKRKLLPSPTLSKIFTEQLLEHIGNCLDHIKMLPIFLQLGFDRSTFLHDYEKHKCSNHHIEILKASWNEDQTQNAPALEFYLDKYFAAIACPNISINYTHCLQELKQIDERLFQINEQLIDRWTKMKLDRDDPSEEDYIIIAEDYIAEMKAWAGAKCIK